MTDKEFAETIEIKPDNSIYVHDFFYQGWATPNFQKIIASGSGDSTNTQLKITSGSSNFEGFKINDLKMEIKFKEVLDEMNRDEK